MVVVDSSVLIHLMRIGRLIILKQYFKKIKITQEIYNEIGYGIGADAIEDACKEWISIEPKSKSNGEMSKIEGIEEADISIIMLAEKEKDILLSNDSALISVARSKNIDCWWLTTFILRCLKKKILNKAEAKQLLVDLIESGMRLDNLVYSKILEEIERL